MANTLDPKLPARLMSLDALRGFDMFWILGAGGFVVQLIHVLKPDVEKTGGWAAALADQFQHKSWEGLAFEDLIFPLFVFIAGVSTVFSLTKELQLHGRSKVYGRIVRRTLLLFALGIFYSGGLSRNWPDVRITGVLQRIALAYCGAALTFCVFRLRGIVATTIGLLVGYWALMTFVPFPDLKLDQPTIEAAARKFGTNDVPTILARTPERISGVYEKGLNLSNYLDARFLPGRKYDRYFCPEGLLSTLPAIATCLLGVLAGLLLRNTEVSERKKFLILAGAGLAGLLVGWLWGLQFPVIKKIWTSSYVLVAGGYSALLLAAFYLVIDIWKVQAWCQPLVWIGANSITIYILAPLVNFRDVARRLVGGDIQQFFDSHVGRGVGELVITAASFVLIFWLLGFLYRRKVFIRL